ncbi:MAG: zinc-dependent metalloprotease [Acidimicrobiales bacterium]
MTPARPVISWDMATRVAVRVAGRDPLSRSYHYGSLQPDFEELTAQAEELVAATTGWHSLAGPARARVTDRAGWVRANVASFQRLLGPVMAPMESRLAMSPLFPVGRVVTGVQVGTILGWMSTRVLGQYDLLIIEDDRPEDQDIVYFVGPNILSLEKRFGFSPRQFRLWLALHEVTHRLQFTAVPWMKEYFLGLVNSTMAGMNPDPRALLDAIKRAADEIRSGRNPLAEAGVVGLVASPEQRLVLSRVQGLMSLLEGHGDVIMDRAGHDHIPSAERFARVLRQRRAQISGPAKLLQQVIGLEAKMRQYAQGEEFIAAVEAQGGPHALDRAWRGSEWLPTLDEIRQPTQWLARTAELAASRSGGVS